MAARFCLLAFG